MHAKPVIFVWPGDLHLESADRPNYKTALCEHTLEVRLTGANEAEGSDRITFACDLSGRYNPYPMVEPVVRETKFC